MKKLVINGISFALCSILCTPVIAMELDENDQTGAATVLQRTENGKQTPEEIEFYEIESLKSKYYGEKNTIYWWLSQNQQTELEKILDTNYAVPGEKASKFKAALNQLAEEKQARDADEAVRTKYYGEKNTIYWWLSQNQQTELEKILDTNYAVPGEKAPKFKAFLGRMEEEKRIGEEIESFKTMVQEGSTTHWWLTQNQRAELKKILDTTYAVLEGKVSDFKNALARMEKERA